jgi:hypothetical protein
VKFLKVSNILKALWHIETLAPGEVPNSSTIDRRYTYQKIKNQLPAASQSEEAGRIDRGDYLGRQAELYRLG